MRIGELASRAGINVQTVLYYERRRLLPRPPRTSGGYRSYTDADLAQVHFIRQTQTLGFTLREIAALQSVHGSPGEADGGDKGALFRIVSNRLTEVDAEIAALERIREALREAIDQPSSSVAVCPAAAMSLRGDAVRPPRHRRRKTRA
jgi:DNA-binding transcriptional MerR regulator